jgi:hypothetical protein
VMFGVAAVSGLLAVYVMWSYAAPAVPVAVGLESQTDYLKGFDLYRASEFINKELPRDARVALLGETRGFYIDRDYLWADSGHNAIVPAGDQASRIKWLASHGYRYILVNGLSFTLEPKAQAGLRLVYGDQNGQVSVWEVDSTSP